MRLEDLGNSRQWGVLRDVSGHKPTRCMVVPVSDDAFEQLRFIRLESGWGLCSLGRSGRWWWWLPGLFIIHISQV